MEHILSEARLGARERGTAGRQTAQPHHADSCLHAVCVLSLVGILVTSEWDLPLRERLSCPHWVEPGLGSPVPPDVVPGISSGTLEVGVGGVE